MCKFIEGGESQIYMPPIFDIYTIKEMKMEAAMKTQMPTDFSGIFGYMYSIVGESDTAMNQEVKLVVIGEEGTGKNLIIDKFFEDNNAKKDESKDERFKYV